MKFKFYILLIFFIILLVLVWFLTKESASAPVLDNQGDINQVNQITMGQAQVILQGQVFDLLVADEPAEQRQGLSGRDSLGEKQAMVFVFDQSKIMNFWMKDMKMDIDLLWIAGDKIVAYEKNMLAPQAGTADTELQIYTSPFPVDRVLELPSGTIEALDIKINDQVKWQNLTTSLE